MNKEKKTNKTSKINEDKDQTEITTIEIKLSPLLHNKLIHNKQTNFIVSINKTHIDKIINIIRINIEPIKYIEKNYKASFSVQFDKLGIVNIIVQRKDQKMNIDIILPKNIENIKPLHRYTLENKAEKILNKIYSADNTTVNIINKNSIINIEKIHKLEIENGKNDNKKIYNTSFKRKKIKIT